MKQKGRVYKRGDIFYIDYYCKGRRFREPVSGDKRHAELTLQQKLLQVAEGKININRVKFADFADDYLEFHSSLNKSFHKDELNVAILKKTFGNMCLTEITTLDVTRFVALGKDIPTSTNRRLALLKSIFNRAIEGRLITFNPCKGVKKYKEKGRLRYLEEDEIRNLLANCSGMIRAIIMTAIFTGMRKNELLGLKWGDCDFEKHLIHLTQTKNDEPRYIPLTNEAVRTLTAIPKHPKSPYVFYKKNGKRYMDIRKSFCNPKMVMSYSTNLKMSYSKVAIISLFGGGYYGRKGRLYGHAGGIEEAACSS